MLFGVTSPTFAVSPKADGMFYITTAAQTEQYLYANLAELKELIALLQRQVEEAEKGKK